MRERPIFLRFPAAAFFTQTPYIISANGRVLIHNVRSESKSDSAPSQCDVCFSNRPVGIKRFQAIHDCGVDVAHGLVLLSGLGTKALPSWDFLSVAYSLGNEREGYRANTEPQSKLFYSMNCGPDSLVEFCATPPEILAYAAPVFRQMG
jgi:hypothetical protein